jgi:hypothetical protein
VADIDDWQRKYGNQPSPTPSPTGIDKYTRTPAQIEELRRQAAARANQQGAPAVTQEQKPGLDFWGTVGKGFGDAGAGFGKLFGGINKGLQDRAETHTANVGKFWETGGGLWGKQNNSPVASKTVGVDLSAPNLGPNWRGGKGGGGDDLPVEDERSFKSYGDFITMAQELMEQFGLGGGGVNYDPQRQAARSQWADADARTAAMYRQLQGSIEGDAAGINQNYQGAITANDQRTQDTQEDINGAYSTANDESARMAKALGIEEAVANTINAGNFGGLDQADAVADTAQRGQIAATQYGENQQNALDANRTTAQSAGLAGANTRAVRQNELSRILAQLDAEEQQANAQSRQNNSSQILGLAGDLFGNSTETQQYADKMDIAAAQAAADMPTPATPKMSVQDAMNFANQLMGFNEENPMDDKDERSAFNAMMATLLKSGR